MAKINCFDLMPSLLKDYPDRINESMSETQIRDEGIKIALTEHEKLHNDLQDLKKSISPKPDKYTPEPYISPDKSKEVKGITDTYNAKIEEKKKEFQEKQAAQKEESAVVVTPPDNLPEPITELPPQKTEEKPKVEEKKEDIPPPPQTPEPPKEEIPETPKEAWTAITKLRDAEIKEANDFYNSLGKKSWGDSLNEGFDMLKSKFPDKSINDAAREFTNNLAFDVTQGSDHNPSSKELAIIEYHKAKVEQDLGELTGFDSGNPKEKADAQIEFSRLYNDLINTVIATNRSEAGRAFGIRQMEMNLGDTTGLKVRRIRMEIMKGEPLDEDDLKFSSEMWEKEKEAMDKMHEAEKQGMQQQFDSEIERIKKEYEEKLKQKGQTKAEKEKAAAREKIEKKYSNKQEDFINKIKSWKSKGLSADPFLLTPIWNGAIDGIAKLVSGGMRIAEAIEKHISDNKIDKINAEKIRKTIDDLIVREVNRDDKLSQIKDLIKDQDNPVITKDMVAKNIIKDYVGSFIGSHPIDAILGEATKELKSVLPDLTEDQLRQAFLKQGDYKIDSEKQIVSGLRKSDIDLKTLETLKQKKQTLENDKKLPKNSSSRSQDIIDESIKKVDEEIDKEVLKQGQKVTYSDNDTTASNKLLAESHNQRIDDIIKDIDNKISDPKTNSDSRNILEKLKLELGNGKMVIDENNALSQKLSIKQTIKNIEDISNRLERGKSPLTVSMVRDMQKQIRLALDNHKINETKVVKAVKLDNTIKALEQRTKEYQRKLNAGEFTEKESVPLVNKNIAYFRALKALNEVESQYRKKQDDYEKANRSFGRKALDVVNAIYMVKLIGGLSTDIKIAAFMLTNPAGEAASKLTSGQAIRILNPELYHAAKKGGEGSSGIAIGKGVEAGLGLKGWSKEARLMKKLDKIKDKGDDHSEVKNLIKQIQDLRDKNDRRYKDSTDKYNSELSKLKVIEDADEKESKAYKEQEDKVNFAKKSMEQANVISVGNVMYDFIGSSNFEDMLQAFMYRANNIEKQTGTFHPPETFEKSNYKIADREGLGFINYINADNFTHTLGFLSNGLHSALKTPSGRFRYAVGVISRLEALQDEGVDIRQPETQALVMNEAILDWNKGKFQQDNFVTDLWARWMSGIDKDIEEKGKGTFDYKEGVKNLLHFTTPVTRVPVNILWEMAGEYGAGLLVGAAKYYRAKGGLRNEILASGIEKATPEFKETMKEKMSQMDSKDAALIVSAFRKGGFGLGLSALVMMSGVLQFGGYTGDEKRKKESKLKKGELNPEDIILEGTKISSGKPLGKIFANLVEHTSALYPVITAANLVNVYNRKLNKGETTVEAAKDAIRSSLKHILTSIPQTSAMDVSKLSATGLLSPRIPIAADIAEWNDVDADGNMIKRKILEPKDYLDLLTLHRGKILSEDNYNEAAKDKSAVRKRIGEIRQSNITESDKESRIEALNKRWDEQLKIIRAKNEKEYNLLHK